MKNLITPLLIFTTIDGVLGLVFIYAVYMPIKSLRFSKVVASLFDEDECF